MSRTNAWARLGAPLSRNSWADANATVSYPLALNRRSSDLRMAASSSTMATTGRTEDIAEAVIVGIACVHGENTTEQSPHSTARLERPLLSSRTGLPNAVDNNL